MSDVVWQGLGLSVLGIGLTFAALGLVILAIIWLQRVFPPAPAASGERETAEVPAIHVPVESPEEEIVAAIAAALAYLRSEKAGASALGVALQAERGRWWTMGRLQQLRGGSTLRRYSRRAR